MQQEQKQHRKRLYNFATNFSGNQRHTRCIRFHTKVATKCVYGNKQSLSDDSSSIEECYEARCCINYGDIRQVRVQFHSSSLQSCDFYWKKRERRNKARRKYKRGLLLQENAGDLSEQEDLLDNSVFWGADEAEFRVESPKLEKAHEYAAVISHGKKTLLKIDFVAFD